MGVNDDLRARAVAHAHLIERLKAGEVRRILGMLNRNLYPELVQEIEARLARITERGFDAGQWTTKRMRELAEAIDMILAAQIGKAGTSLARALSKASVVEAQAAVGTLESATPGVLEIEFTIPSPELLKSVVTSRPFQGRVLKDWWATVEGVTRQRVRDTIAKGIVEGLPTPKIVQRLVGTKAAGFTDGVLDQSRRAVTAVVRTAVNHTMTHAREATFEANADVIKGVQWVSTLDTRTTETCMALDGKVFEVGEGPRPPAHYGCRSTTTPVLKSWRELGINAKELTPGSRASMDGQVPDTQTYGDWLKSQPLEVQEEALGAEKARLFRSGSLTVDQLVSANLTPLTLEQLRRRLGLAA